MAAHPVETYLRDLAQIHQTGGGTAEESYYGSLETLLNEIGATLTPKVRCVSQLKNIGAGQPDFGLFTAQQFQREGDERPIAGQTPERGVIEAKSWSDDASAAAESAQVADYWRRYGLILATNFREFVLVGHDAEGKRARLESFRIADSESAFRAALAHPRRTADEQGDRLVDFLKRMMLHRAPLTEPEDLAWFLASYAREARARVEATAGLPGLAALRKGLEETLGMKFEGDRGEQFFRATFVQTLFYGIFSSWVLWSREHPKQGDRFNWHDAAWTLHVPMIASLFEQIATPQRLKPLGVDEVLDWAALVLNRVDRRVFFQKFEQEQAVQYFYEPFLNAYDPELRKELGVWYTPPEIVKYQVERVDRVLREELDIPDGLADERVVVLDPCCGTGAYLVETLRRIHETLHQKGCDALVAQRVKRAAVERIFGFEILPAPFVISHLQIGLLLRQLGAPLRVEGKERAGVYLTNALTGWEPPQKPKDELPLFPELVAEREAANKVKYAAPILVILGNPPYNAFAGTSPEEEGGLVEPYKEGLNTPVEKGGWGIKKFNLDDLYVRFFRIAERRIVKSGRGVVTYISNYSWTSEPSFVVLRKRLLESFDKFWIENMHGNRKISEYAPDGRTSETVFAIPGFSAGIQQGVVISLWVKRGEILAGKRVSAEVLYRDDINAAKAVERRQQLLASLAVKHLDRKYQKATPNKANRFSLRPGGASSDYLSWPLLSELCAIPPFNGPVERRANSLIVFGTERKRLEHVKVYLDPNQSDETVALLEPAFMTSSGEYRAKQARTLLKGKVRYNARNITRYPFKPFDVRFSYLDPAIQPLFSRPSPNLLAQRFEGNTFFISRDTADKTPEGPPFYLSPLVCDYDFISGHARHFPLLLQNGERLSRKHCETLLDIMNEGPRTDLLAANLSLSVRAYMKSLRMGDPDADAETAALIWMHALAIGYSPAYLAENANGIRQDWPRIPLPNSKRALLQSAELGRRVAAFLDTEKPVQGVTCGPIRAELRGVAVIARVGGRSLNPDEGHIDLTAGWGHAGKGGVCMPGGGRYEVRSAKDERQKTLFGEQTVDVYLNDIAYWANIPLPVWEYYIGGYQVIKKWLSYREKPLLGRGLTLEEAEYVTEMARRLAALVLLQPELDANYAAVKAATWPWPD